MFLSQSDIVDFVVNRVRQLETCHNSSAHINQRTTDTVCPFSWPSDALSWVEGLLGASSTTDSADELFETPGDTVDRFLSGLASRDPAVDPFHALRKLAKQLHTISLLRQK